MSRVNNYLSRSEQEVDSVNYVLEDRSQKIDILRSKPNVEGEMPGFDYELDTEVIVRTVRGRIDRKNRDDWVGLTDETDCQKNDIWRVINERDEQLHFRVVDVLPRNGGCEVVLKDHAEWAK